MKTKKGYVGEYGAKIIVTDIPHLDECNYSCSECQEKAEKQGQIKALKKVLEMLNLTFNFSLSNQEWIYRNRRIQEEIEKELKELEN